MMSGNERSVILAIVEALRVPRNRNGALAGDGRSVGGMNEWARAYNLPHGGVDRIDQATMLLQALVGLPIESIAGNTLERDYVA